MKHVFSVKKLKTQIAFLQNNPELIKKFTFKDEKKVFVSKTEENIKIAKQWANNLLNSEDIKIELEKLNKEALDCILTGKPTSYLNEQLLNEIKNFKYDNN